MTLWHPKILASFRGSHGPRAGYLESPRCAICEGQGRVTADNPATDPGRANPPRQPKLVSGAPPARLDLSVIPIDYLRRGISSAATMTGARGGYDVVVAVM